MPAWTAEQVVDAQLVRRLVHEQFAPLPERSVELVSEGWDYAVYRIDDEWAFRFPRRVVALPGMELELAVLPLLAPLLPVRVPEPVYVGEPSGAFPWRFYGARFIHGVSAEDAGLGDGERIALAPTLARALTALHAPGTLAAVGSKLPFDPIKRADMHERVPRTRAALEAVADLWTAPPLVDEVLESALALPPAEPTAVCHGDLHFRQLLVEGAELRGIVDWVDVCRSDPGVDLQLVWSFLPPAGRAAFLAAYGDVSDASLLRARVLALFLSATTARYGRDEGLAAVTVEAVAGLERAAG